MTDNYNNRNSLTITVLFAETTGRGVYPLTITKSILTTERQG